MSWLDQFFPGYNVIQNANGIPVPQRQTIRLVANLTATDDPVNLVTDLSASSGGGGSIFYQTVEANGLAVTQRDTINFIGGTVADNSGSSRTDVTLPPALPGSDGYYILQRSSGVYSWVTPTQDMISAGLTVTLSGSSNGTFECGATWTTTGITCSPACNAAGVTAATINDTDGGSTNVLGTANPLSSPSATYTKSTAGATEGISVTLTKGGFTKTSNSLTSTWLDRYFVGSGSTGAGTSATASGNNASLASGDSGTLTGTLATFGVGASFNIPAGAAAYWYLLVAHTSSAMTFKSGGAPFPMTRVTSAFTFTNQFSVGHSFDLYVSNQLTQAYTVVRDT